MGNKLKVNKIVRKTRSFHTRAYQPEATHTSLPRKIEGYYWGASFNYFPKIMGPGLSNNFFATKIREPRGQPTVLLEPRLVY